MNEDFRNLASLFKSILLDLCQVNNEVDDNESIVDEIITLSQCISDFQTNNAMDFAQIQSFYQKYSNNYSAFLVSNIPIIKEQIKLINNEIISQLQTKSKKLGHLNEYTIENIGLKSYNYEEILKTKNINEITQKKIFFINLKCNFVRLVYEFFNVGIQRGYLTKHSLFPDNDVHDQSAAPEVIKLEKESYQSSDFEKHQQILNENIQKYYKCTVLRRNKINEKVLKLSSTTNEALQLIELLNKEVQVFCTLFGVECDDSSGLSYVICDISSKMNDLMKEIDDFKINNYQVPIELNGDHISIKSAQKYLENSLNNYALIDDHQRLQKRIKNIVVQRECVKFNEDNKEPEITTPNILHLDDERQITMNTLESLMANLLKIKADDNFSYDKKKLKNLKSKVIQLQQHLASSNALDKALDFHTSLNETVNEYNHFKITKAHIKNKTTFERLDALSRIKVSK